MRPQWKHLCLNLPPGGADPPPPPGGAASSGTSSRPGTTALADLAVVKEAQPSRLGAAVAEEEEGEEEGEGKGGGPRGAAVAAAPRGVHDGERHERPAQHSLSPLLSAARAPPISLRGLLQSYHDKLYIKNL